MVHADVGNDVCSFISPAKFLWRLVQAPLLIKVGTHDATSRRDRRIVWTASKSSRKFGPCD